MKREGASDLARDAIQIVMSSDPIESHDVAKLQRHVRTLERRNASLNDRVRRLEAVLRSYGGETALPKMSEGGLKGDEMPPSPPWSDQTAPLLLAYDRRIAELTGALEESKDRILDFTARTQAISDENAKLRAELKQYVDKAIESVDASGTMPLIGSGSNTSATAVEMRELVEQLDIANQTVDLVSDNNTALESEVSTLRASLAESVARSDEAQIKLSECRGAVEKLRAETMQLNKEKASAETMLRDMSALNSRLKANLAQEREEITAVTTQRDAERETIIDVKKAMDALRVRHTKEIDAADGLRRTHTETIEKLRAEVDAASQERIALSTAHDTLVKEHNAVRNACAGMLEDLTKYERQLSSMKQAEERVAAREADADRRIHESALLQEQAEVRATRSRKEADRLRQVLKTAGADALRREQYLVAQERERMKKLEAQETEMKIILQRCASAEAKFERARREKSSAETNAERLAAAVATAEERMLSTIDDIVQKTHIERERK